MVKPSSKMDLSRSRKSAEKVATAVELRAIRLESCEAKRSRQRIRFAGQLDVKLNISGEVSEQTSLDFRLDLSIAVAGEEGQLSIDVSYLATYEVKVKPRRFSEEQIDAFGLVSVIQDVWPYAREAIQSITTRMLLPPLTLPHFRLEMVSGLMDSPSSKSRVAPPEKKSRRKRAD